MQVIQRMKRNGNDKKLVTSGKLFVSKSWRFGDTEHSIDILPMPEQASEPSLHTRLSLAEARALHAALGGLLEEITAEAKP